MSEPEIVEPKKKQPIKPYIVGSVYAVLAIVAYFGIFAVIGLICKVIVLAFKYGWNFL
jgi:hypothetical protein